MKVSEKLAKNRLDALHVRGILKAMPTGAATPHEELMKRLLDSSTSKSELEWAAKREIGRLRKIADAAAAWAREVGGKESGPVSDTLLDRWEQAERQLLEAVRQYGNPRIS